MQVTIEVGELAFQFHSQTEWACKAQNWFRNSGLGDGKAICIDAKGRVCRIGRHFMRAEKDGAYPIKVYPIEPAEGGGSE